MIYPIYKGVDFPLLFLLLGFRVCKKGLGEILDYSAIESSSLNSRNKKANATTIIMSKHSHVPRRPCFSWVSLLLYFTCLRHIFLQCDVWLQARNGLLQAFCNFEGNMITKNLSASEMFTGRMYNGVQIVYYNVCPFSRA